MHFKPLVALAVLLFWVSHAVADEVLTLAYNEDSAVGAVGAKVLQRVFDRSRIGVAFVSRPAARATLEASSGRLDGEVARIATYGTKFPDLVRIDPPWLRVRTVAYAKSERHLHVRSAQDMAPLTVGVVRGIQHAAQVVVGLPHVTEVVRSKQLFEMLEAGRFDVAVDSDINGRIFLKQLGRESGVKEIAEFGQQEIFLYVHRRHSALIPRISRAIEESLARGDIKRWLDAAEAGANS